MDDNGNFALARKPPSAAEKAKLDAERILTKADITGLLLVWP
jgi:hypothetical protein